MATPTGVHHVGVPVADLERSLAFYRDLLGIEPDFVASGKGAKLAQAVGLPDAVLSFAFLRVGDSLLELLEYERPRGRPYDRRNCDVGAVHVAFEVEDIDEAYEAFRAKGVVFRARPFLIESGPLVGCSFAYFDDPDGVQLEIFQKPRA